MNDSKKIIDPIPEEFGSYEEAAEFWDTHDTTDYPNVGLQKGTEVRISKLRKESLVCLIHIRFWR